MRIVENSDGEEALAEGQAKCDDEAAVISAAHDSGSQGEERGGKGASNGLQLRNCMFIALSVIAAGIISGIATFSHAAGQGPALALMAVAFSIAATIPAYWFSQAITNGAVKQLSVVLWRIGWLLPPLWFMSQLEGSPKSAFMMCLLACYFVGLTVESAMLIRDARLKS